MDDTQQMVAAHKQALIAILVRNWDVLDWYIQLMFQHIPPMYRNVLFYAMKHTSKDTPLTKETMWAVIPAFLSSLSDEHFGVFMQHMRSFAQALDNEYSSYLALSPTEETSTAEISQPVPIARTAHDDYRAIGERENNVRTPVNTEGFVSPLPYHDT